DAAVDRERFGLRPAGLAEQRPRGIERGRRRGGRGGAHADRGQGQARGPPRGAARSRCRGGPGREASPPRPPRPPRSLCRGAGPAAGYFAAVPPSPWSHFSPSSFGAVKPGTDVMLRTAPPIQNTVGLLGTCGKFAAFHVCSAASSASVSRATRCRSVLMTCQP